MTRTILTTAVILAMTLVPGVACAEDDVTSLSYISYLERFVRLTTDQGKETMEAVVNMPVLVGDRLDTARGARAELVLADGTLMWVDQYSTVDFDAIAYSRENPSQRTILFLAEGSIAIEIPQAALGEQLVRVDSPAGTIFLSGPGLHRMELRDGMVKVEAHAGLAELPAGAHSRLLRGGQFAWVDGAGIPDTRTLRITYDEFWNWVEDRRRPTPAPRSARHVSAPAHQVRVLDTYGEWVYVTSMSSYMWRPRVAMAWTPYSYGRWVWTPVGWTWVAYEPWGWLPYHYGSWYFSSRWGWVWHWDRYWGPAWVHWIYTPGYIGWVPRGYYDWWYWRNYRYGGPSYGPYPPSRWARTTLDFRGRVRIRDVDLRHWNVVPADRFTASRLDRVRVDSTRLARELPADRELYVRSGPLISREPIREAPERHLSALLRDREVGRGGEGSDLAPILRREARTGDERTAPTRGVRETDIGQMSREARGRAAAEAPRDPAIARGERDRPATTTDRPGADPQAPGLARGERPATDRQPVSRPAPADRGSLERSGRDAPPSGRTDPAPRAPATRPEPQRPAPAPRTDRSPETTRPAPRTESPPARPAPRTESPPPPSQPAPTRSEPSTRQPSSPPPARSEPAARQPSPPSATRNQPATQPGRRDTSTEPSVLQRNTPRSAEPAGRGGSPAVAGRSTGDARAAPRIEPRLLRTQSTARTAEPAAPRPAPSVFRERQPVTRTQAAPSRSTHVSSPLAPAASRSAPGPSRPAPTTSRPAPGPSRSAPTASRPAPGPSRPAPAASRPAPAPSRPAPAASRPAPAPSRPAPAASRPAPAPSRSAPATSRPAPSASSSSAPAPSRSAPSSRSTGNPGSSRRPR